MVTTYFELFCAMQLECMHPLDANNLQYICCYENHACKV